MNKLSKQAVQVFVLGSLLLFALFFLIFILPHKTAVLSDKHYGSLLGFYTGGFLLLVPLFVFNFRKSEDIGKELAYFAGGVLLCAYLVPTVFYTFESHEGRVAEFQKQFRRQCRDDFVSRGPSRGKFGKESLIGAALFVRQKTAQIEACESWLEKVKRSFIFGCEKFKMLEELKELKERSLHIRNKEQRQFLAVSKEWLRQLTVNTKTKEERDRKRWLVADVYLEIDKRMFDDVDRDIHLLYQRTQRELGSPLKFTLEKRPISRRGRR